jgi:hypothetical protein
MVVVWLWHLHQIIQNSLKKIIIVDALPCLFALMNPTFQTVENKTVQQC